MCAIIQNNPARAGKSIPSTFAYLDREKRYAVRAVHTRFDKVCWMVTDAFLVDAETELASIVRQEDTREAAVAGFSTKIYGTLDLKTKGTRW